MSTSTSTMSSVQGCVPFRRCEPAPEDFLAFRDSCWDRKKFLISLLDRSTNVQNKEQNVLPKWCLTEAPLNKPTWHSSLSLAVLPFRLRNSQPKSIRRAHARSPRIAIFLPCCLGNPSALHVRGHASVALLLLRPLLSLTSEEFSNVESSLLVSSVKFSVLFKATQWRNQFACVLQALLAR